MSCSLMVESLANQIFFRLGVAYSGFTRDFGPASCTTRLKRGPWFCSISQP